MAHDVFISHASEDKIEVAIPLKGLLQDRGLDVWLDETEMTLGDRARPMIEEAITSSQLCVVILSQIYFKKPWPLRELNIALMLELERGKFVLPVLHGISQKELKHKVPSLGDHLVVSTDNLKHVADQIQQAIDAGRTSRSSQISLGGGQDDYLRRHKPPQPPMLYGRRELLIAINRYIKKQKLRAVSLHGKPGCGTTAIAKRIAFQWAQYSGEEARFTTVLFFSVRETKELWQRAGYPSALGDITLDRIAQAFYSDAGNNRDVIGFLVGQLSTHRCMIILHDIDGWEVYGKEAWSHFKSRIFDLLERLPKASSFFLLAGREIVYSDTGVVKVLKVPPLSPADWRAAVRAYARGIDSGRDYSDEDLDRLSARTGGSLSRAFDTISNDIKEEAHDEGFNDVDNPEAADLFGARLVHSPKYDKLLALILLLGGEAQVCDLKQILPDLSSAESLLAIDEHQGGLEVKGQGGGRTIAIRPDRLASLQEIFSSERRCVEAAQELERDLVVWAWDATPTIEQLESEEQKDHPTSQTRLLSLVLQLTHKRLRAGEAREEAIDLETLYFRLTLALSTVHHQQGNWYLAEPLLKEARELVVRPEHKAWLDVLLARQLAHQGAYGEAEQMLRHWQEHPEIRRHSRLVLEILLRLGQAQHLLAPEEARSRLDRVVQQASQSGLSWRDASKLEFQARGYLAEIDLDRRDAASARAHLIAMHELHRSLRGWSQPEAYVHRLQGDVFRLERDFEKAQEEYNLALQLAKQANPGGRLRAQVNLSVGLLRAERGDFDAAVRFLDVARHEFHSLGLELWERRCEQLKKQFAPRRLYIRDRASTDSTKVALIYPEVLDLARYKEKRKEFPPFGVLYLAATLEEAGHEVKVFKVSPENPRLDLREYEAIGFSIPSSATYGLMQQTRRESLYGDNPLLMAGGVHVNFFPEESLQEMEVDVVGVGECERTIVDLVARRSTRSFEDVPGVVFRERKGHLLRNAPLAVAPDLDWLPAPARHLLDARDVIMPDRLAGIDRLPMAHVMFSRGCPYPCRFCAVSQTRIQYRSGQGARLELEALTGQYRIEGFAIVDDNFIVDERKVREICNGIRHLGLQWSALSRVDAVDPDLLRDLRSAGCVELKFGVESGSVKILREMRKMISPEQIRWAVQEARRAGIGVKVFIIHGYPGENRETTRETIDLLKSISKQVDRVSVLRFVPLPGTYTYNHPERFRIRGTNRSPDWDGDWSRYHIHHNHHHWWGSDEDFAEMTRAFQELAAYVASTWPPEAWGGAAVDAEDGFS